MDMADKTMKRYWIVGVALLCLLIFIGVNFRYDIQNARKDLSFSILEDYEIRQEADAGVPLQKKMVYTLTAPGVSNGRSELAVYTVHQNIQVYIGGELIYSLRPFDKNPFGSTPGCIWHFVPVTEADEGKELQIVLSSPYEATFASVPFFYFGEKNEIVLGMLGRDILPMLIGVVTIIVGIGFIVYVICIYRNERMDKNLAHLGMFAVSIGAWQVCDLPAAPLFFLHKPVVSYVPYVALLLMPVPFVLFVRGLHNSRDHMAWKIMIASSYVNIILCIGAQLLRIADFRQTIWITHLTFFFVIGMGIFMVIRECLREGLTDKAKLNVVCLCVCLSGMALDMARYYMTAGTSTMFMGIVGFLIYIIVLGSESIKETRKLMEAGRDAKRFEQLAYHDQMTGIYNRLAWTDISRSAETDKYPCIVVMMDLNELKKFNDTNGHEYGDIYIKESAQIIQEAFQDTGICFRMGGDEFCVLIKSGRQQECERCLKVMQDKIAQYNTAHPGLQISIAHGYARYDKMMDTDLNDTRSRADAAMYSNKFKMKSGEGI